ncbi:MAG: VWA domain-containing protein, partial [Cyanobacteria bacterium HKST-UBA02]|nr:VWA domain-containing protein [Cyanobacteria bacterium HKST-UBA02]
FLSKGDVQEKDFLLYYTLSDKELAANLITHKLNDEKGFFMLTLSPPVKGQKVMAKDVVLVADTSGSMRGEKMEQARAALEYVVKALNPEDRFSLVQFNTDAEAFAGNLLSADADNKKKAVSFIQEMESRGGTNIGDALATAVSILDDAKAGSRPAFLILMTDGEPTVGKTALQELLKTVSIKRDLRLFDFGIGYDVNTRLLNKLAEEHHGTSQYLEPDENLETALSSFYAKIRNPVLSDVTIGYEGVDVKDIYPRSVKDIFAGSQLLLLGRYKEGGKATIKLTGKVDGVEKSFSFPVDFAARSADNSYLPRIWAMRRIGHLTEVAQENDNNKEIVDEIVELSKRYGIISAYTSFLSKDPNERRGGPVPRPMPTTAMGAMRGPRDMNMFQVAPRAEEAGKGLEARFAFMPNQRFRAMAAGSPVPGSADGAYLGSAGADDEKESFGRALRSAKSSGQAAVALQKALGDLRSNMDGRAAADSSQVKVIGDKTFYLVNGYWVDGSFEKIEKAQLKEIEFGSKDYFELARKGLASYLGAGPQMILVHEGQCYRISKSR